MAVCLAGALRLLAAVPRRMESTCSGNGNRPQSAVARQRLWRELVDSWQGSHGGEGAELEEEAIHNEGSEMTSRQPQPLAITLASMISTRTPKSCLHSVAMTPEVLRLGTPARSLRVAIRGASPQRNERAHRPPPSSWRSAGQQAPLLLQPLQTALNGLSAEASERITGLNGTGSVSPRKAHFKAGGTLVTPRRGPGLVRASDLNYEVALAFALQQGPSYDAHASSVGARRVLL